MQGFRGYGGRGQKNVAEGVEIGRERHLEPGYKMGRDEGPRPPGFGTDWQKCLAVVVAVSWPELNSWNWWLKPSSGAAALSQNKSFLFDHLLNKKTMAEQNSTMGDQVLLNALLEMLRNVQGKDNSMMLKEGISKCIPTPSMPLSTSGIMPEDVSIITPSSMQCIGIEDHFMPSTSTSKDHNIPSTSIRDVSRIPAELNMPTPDRTAQQFINNPSSMGSVRVLPPTPEQVSWRSLLESQSKILRILPDTLEYAETREEISKQIQSWERALLESAGLPSDQPESSDIVANVPIRASISTSKTATISSVTTRGMQEVTILLTLKGNVLKDEKGIKFFHFIFHRAKQFGNTIQVDWRKQADTKKNELFTDVIKSFGNPGFNKEIIINIVRKYIHSKRDNLRSKLTKDLRYPRPAWITDQLVWDELMKDVKFKRKVHNNPNYRPSARSGGKRRLRDTTKATQARVSSIGSHKLGSGGYNSIRGGMVHQFEKEASEEDLKYALLHGSQGLQQRMLDQGEKLITGHEFEEAQQTKSSGEVSRSEHEEELEAHAELCVAHNESIVICGPRQKTIPEIQQMTEKNNNEGLQCDDQSVFRIRIVPRRKRTQRKRMDSNIP